MGRTNGALCELHGAEAQEGDRIQAHVQAMRIVGEGDEAVHTVCEGRDLQCSRCSMTWLSHLLPHTLYPSLHLVSCYFSVICCDRADVIRGILQCRLTPTVSSAMLSHLKTLTPIRHSSSLRILSFHMAGLYKVPPLITLAGLTSVSVM